jgi:gas vesicle protein
MNNSRAAAATIVGAVIGGMAGYLLFTDAGRELRRRLEPMLDDYATELTGFRETLTKAAGVASEGWKLLNEAMEPTIGESRYPTQHQRAPF